jgi:4a-hydroxytetrahydrobiopterin dehydratase
MKVRKVKDVMEEYFSDVGSRKALMSEAFIAIKSHGVPIKASQQSEWEVVSDPNRLMKRFKLSPYKRLTQFVHALLDYQEEVQHHAKITIEHDEVIIEVYTHDVNDVTELDMEYATAADQILEDVLHYEMEVRVGGY